MLLPHGAPWGCFVLVKFKKQGWVGSCIVEGQCVSVVYYVSELGGCCPTLSKFMVLGFLLCDGIPTPSKCT